MAYQDGLKQAHSDLEPLAALRSPVTVLLGVSDLAGQALGGLGLKTVLDLATSPFFSVAASVASGAGNGATQAFPLGEIPGGLLVDGGPTDLASLARADLAVLRALTPATASALKQALQVDTVGDLGRWPSYRAAKDILDVVSGSFSDETDGEVAELIPTLGQYPTERHFYSTVVLDQVAQQNTVDLATAGPIDLSPTLSLDFGFSVPAVGARLTFQQSWFAQGFALGNLLHSLALAPGESTRIAVLDWSRQTGTTTSESISETEQLSNATTHNRAVSEVQDSVAKEVQSGFSHTESTGTTEEGGAGFGLALGPVLIGGAGGIGHTTTSADSYSSSAGSRSLSASMNQKVMDATQQAASSSRNRRASIVQEVSQQEHEAVSTRIVANYNHMHALTVQYYEVVELYRVSVSLSEAERCLFVPMKVMEFTDPMVQRYQGVLAGAAIDRRARELLTTEFGSVHLTPTTSVPPFWTGIFTTMTGVRLASRATIAVAAGTPEASAATTATTSTTGEATSSTTTSPATGSGTTSSTDAAANRVFRWDVDELSRAARLTSSNVARVDAAGVYLAQNTTLAGLTVTTDRPGPVISAVSLKLHDGSAPIALTRTSVDWRVPQSEPLQEIAEIVVTTEGQGTFAGTMTLELDYLGSRFPLTIPVGAVGNTTTSVCTIGAPEAGPELLQHLNANRLYYNQAIWRSLDASTTALLLSRYKFENQPVANLIDPKPLQVAGNYLVFRMPGFIARRDLVDRTGAAAGGADDASLATWKKWLADKGLNFADFTEQVVPVPTSGVFAEAVLGRSNSAEKLDATRFWNWQDSPIPLQPPEIAAINMDSRAQNIDVRPGQLGQPVLNIVNPTSLPDPTGLGAMIGALQNGGMFRDMSGLAATIGLAQATGADATSAAADATRLAAANMQVAAQHDIEARKVELAKQALAQQGASGGSPKTASEMGSLINSAAARDKQRATEPANGNGAMLPSAGNGGFNGSGGGDYMPGVSDAARGLLGSGSNGGSLQDSAFNRALWGGLGMPASDFVLADAKAAGSAAAPPVVAHLDESHLEEWVHRALDGTHVIGSVAEIVEIFHASTAWPAIEASLSWGDAAAIGAAGAGEAGVAALIGEIAVPLGYVAAIVVTVLALHEAFTTGTRIQTKKGYCYGIMWEALKMPTPNRTFQPWGGDTAEELKEAWDEGIDKGRSAFRSDVKLHNQVLLRIAYEQMTQNRYKFTRAEGRVLNLLWEQVRGSDSIGTHLGWMDGSAPGSEYDEKLDLMDGRGANQPPAQPPQPQPPTPPPPH
jgi:hypothetical protein